MASFSESNNPSAEKQKDLDREIRDMVAALSSRLTHLQHLQKTGHSGQLEDSEGDDGMCFITLAGSNIGATMRGDLDEKTGPDMENEALTTYVNSNFQTVNNSIMLGGSYTANNPGVHLDISDYTEDDDEAHLKEEKRVERKEKESSKGNHETGNFE